jgi:gliding motility-associated-like protein
VSDPSDSYPSGFSLTITSGSDYTVDGLKVKPKQNFFGNLTVPVRVSKGNMSSELFQALVIVQPVNDPPYFSNFDTDPIMVSGTSEVPLVKEVSTSDVDNTTLAFAEILLDSADNLGVLTYTNTANIRGVFDQANGILVFLGEATLEEYDQALQSINYTSNDSTQQYVIITFRLNDGESYSQPYKKQIKISGTELTLDIPTAFTPNGDNVNDTWEITPLQQHESTTIKLKIYNRQGLFLFESDSFTKRWDGRFNGEVLPADSYFFTIEIANGGRVEQRNGAVTILR